MARVQLACVAPNKFGIALAYSYLCNQNKTLKLMKSFNDENFLLQTPTAQRLYHEYAENQPIIDYHCHLIPEYVANDHKFENRSKIWL